jgi:hypothetical protein
MIFGIGSIKVFILILCPLALSAQKIDTFYGPIEVEEPVILELLESRAMQRLKTLHQYGVVYYTTHREEYTRYDHYDKDVLGRSCELCDVLLA